MKHNNLTLKAIIIAVVYWLMDSSLHRLIFREKEFEFIPSDINELWMRVVIVLLLIAFGMYADRHTATVVQKEKEKRIIFNATVSSAQHILNNLLNQMQYFKLMAEETKALDKSTTDLYEQSMSDGKEMIERLSAVDEMSEETIKASVYPTLKK